MQSGTDQQTTTEPGKKRTIRANSIKDLIKVNMELFGLNREQATYTAIIADRMIGAMALRSGKSKSEIYKSINWTNAELASYADVVSMAATWWGTGDTVVCFALKSGTPGEINGITLDTTDQTTTPHTWDDGNHPWLATYGLGATYNPAGPDIELKHLVMLGRCIAFAKYVGDRYIHRVGQRQELG